MKHEPVTVAIVALSTMAALAARASAAERLVGAAHVQKLVRRLSAGSYRVRRRAASALVNLPTAEAPFAVGYIRKQLHNGNASPQVRAPLQRALPTLLLRARRADLRLRAAQWLGADLLAAYHRPKGVTAAWDKQARSLLALAPLRGSPVFLYKNSAALAAAAKYLWRRPSCPSYVVQYAVLAVEIQSPQAKPARLAKWAAQMANACHHVDFHWLIKARARALAADILERNKNLPPALRLYNQAVGDLRVSAQVFKKRPGMPQEALTRAARVVWRSGKAWRDKAHDWIYSSRDLRSALCVYDPANAFAKCLAAYGSGQLQIHKIRNSQAPNYRVSERLFAKAWRAAPFRAGSAVGAMFCEQQLGAPPEKVEKWFHRALLARPGDSGPWAMMFGYLATYRPKFPAATLVQFGEAALATARWNTAIPWLVVKVRILCAHRTLNVQRYYARAGVWTDLHLACAGYCKVHPHSVHYRSAYAYFAVRCKRWKTAARQFKKLGQKFDKSIFASRALFDFYRQRAMARAHPKTKAAG